MIAKWIPPQERSTLAALINSGAQVGTFISLPVSGYLAGTLGWRSTFYLFGALGIAWAIFYYFLCFNSPESHPRISEVKHDMPLINLIETDCFCIAGGKELFNQVHKLQKERRKTASSTIQTNLQ